MRKNEGGQVVVTTDGETLRKPDDMLDELHVPPTHDWKSKAIEQLRVSQRRRKIIRRLIASGAHKGRGKFPPKP